MVMRRAFGDGMVRNELVLELDRYLSGRADATPPEPPLDRVDDEDHIYYGKGAIVMHAIAELIGEEATNGALREFYAAENGEGRAPAASRLVARILAASPEQFRPLVAQWTSEVVLYDVALTAATASKRADGKWELEVRVRAAKSKVNDDGSESAIAMDEPVGIAVYGDDEEERLLASSKQQVRSGESVQRFVLDEEPRRVVVDPTMCLIDRDRFDNVRQVERQARGQRP
jgi:aminopeptidase N